jgi:hypothetical protein
MTKQPLNDWSVLMKLRKSQRSLLFKLFLTLSAVIILILLLKPLFFSSEKEVRAVVDSFYTYEQEGQYSSSWELFHSSMKKRFTKGHYIQDRAHVFMNHFGVETFTYTLGEPEKLKTWKMSEDSSPFKSVYKVTVIQTFKGKYGNFDLEQDIFVVKEKEDWRILWDYNR